MTPKIEVPFKAHASVGNHAKLFNLTGPRAVRWAKKTAPVKTARDEQNWQPWTSMARMGYPQESMTPDTGFGSADQYMRLQPFLEHYENDPSRYEDMLSALQSSNQAVSKYIGRAGQPEDDSWVSRAGHSFLDPYGATMSPERIRAFHADTVAKTTSELQKRLVSQGISPEIAMQRAQLAAQHMVGTPEQFERGIASRIATGRDDIGGPSLGGVASFLGTSGGEAIMPALALGNLAVTVGETGRLLAGNPDAQRRLQYGYEGVLQDDALNNRGGYGFWNTFGRPGMSVLTGSGDPTAQAAAGIHELVSGGTIQNKIQLDALRERMNQTRQWDKARVNRGVPLQQSFGTPEDYERSSARFDDRLTSANAQGDDIAQRWAAATGNPYRNLFTGDPWLGASTAVQSGKNSRLWHPSQWASYFGDRMSNSDTSHDYMMNGEDSRFDQEGTGGFSSYQDMAKAVRGGNYDLRYTDLSQAPLTNAGREYGWWDPRKYMGLREGQVSGMESAPEFRQQFDKRYGDLMDTGEASASDIDAWGRNLGAEKRQAVDFDNRKRTCAQNRAVGQTATGGSNFMIPKGTQSTFGTQHLPPTMQPPGIPPIPAPGAPQKTASVEPEGLPSFAPPQQPERASAPAAHPERPLDLQGYYNYQAGLRAQMARQLGYNRMGSNPYAAEHAPWVNPDAAYGQGFRERWGSMEPGRGARNPWAPFSGLLSQSDRLRLDPVLRQHRQAYLDGQWRPGMAVDPMISRPGMGWTNPLGRVSTFLGLQPGAEAQEREYMTGADGTKGMLGSPEYQKLRGDLGAGKLQPKDFFALTHGNDVTRYDTGLPGVMSSAAKVHAGIQGAQFGDLVDRIRQTSDAQVPAGVQATAL